MGIVDWSVLAHTSVPTEITEKAQARVVAKENRDYALADTLRKEIEAAGFTLIDTKEGFIVEKK